MKELETIIRYLDGEMTGEEKLSFEAELGTNESLKQSLLLIKEVDSVIADKELLNYIQKLKETQALYNSIDLNKKSNDEKKTGTRVLLFTNWKLLAAASITIFVVVSSVAYINFFGPTKSERIFKQYYQRYEADLLTRSSNSTSGASDLTKAIQLYNNDNYAEAISKFTEIINTDKNNAVAHFFIGISYMETKNYETAVQYLSYVINQKDRALIEHAEWYLALCYVKINHYEHSNPLLEKISNSQSYYKSFASDILMKTKH